MNAKSSEEKSAVAQAVKVVATKAKPAAAKPAVVNETPVAAKASAKPAAKPVTKTVTKTVTKPATKPAAKVVAAAKPAARKPAATNAQAKPATKPAPKSVTKPAPTPKPTKAPKARKVKLVRASYTIPDVEYEALSNLKARITKLGTASKKSELLRAGIAVLAQLDDAALKNAIAQVEIIKTGRKAK